MSRKSCPNFVSAALRYLSTGSAPDPTRTFRTPSHPGGPLGPRTAHGHLPRLRSQARQALVCRAFGVQPYFDEAYYVGFQLGGFELGLDPDVTGVPPGPGGCVAYWGVPNLDSAVQQFTKAGATVTAPIQDVGGDIRVATVADPFGNLLGLIENPHFKAS